MWRLREQVFPVDELGVSHQGTILAKVAHHVLEDYVLTQKVSNTLPFFCILNLKFINMNLFLGFCYHNI